jgi:homoserine dehydrogenase
MPSANLCLLGFGNVGRAFARLLLEKRAELLEKYRLEWKVTGIASRRIGWRANPEGYDLHELLHAADPAAALAASPGCASLREWLAAARADVLCEISSVDPVRGHPAVEHIRAALEFGAHAITANKGAVVYGYHELRELASARGRHFLFEATVLGGTPVFSLFREALPAARLLCFRGLLNSTTSLILSRMEHGNTYEEALAHAQELGVAETDPSNDVDGWDAALKVATLATVLMDIPIKPKDIERRGIREVTPEQLRAARDAGKRIRLVGRVDRTLLGRLVARVAPEEIGPDDPLFGCLPTANIVFFEIDTLHGLTIASHRQGPATTAYGLLSDFVHAVCAK